MNIKDTVSSDLTLETLDAGMIPCEGDTTIELVTAVGNRGLEYTIKKLDYENNVQVVPAKGETIDGASSVELSLQGQVLSIASNGESWLKT
jgi:hypothetical protein